MASSNYVVTTVDHPRLTNTDAASIGTFLHEYDQYLKEDHQRVRQVLGADVTTTEAATTVQLKYCVDAEWKEFIIALGFITDVASYKELRDHVLRTYFEGNFKDRKEAIIIEAFDKLIENNLRMDLSDTDARSRTEMLFVSYRSHLTRPSPSWLTSENAIVALYHVLSAIRPESLRLPLQSDMSH